MVAPYLRHLGKATVVIAISLSLSGCAVVEAIINALASGAAEPKLVYALPDQARTVQVASILPSGRVLVLGNLPTFSQDNNRVREVRLSPAETNTAVLQFTDFDSVLEVFETQSRTRLAFFTDNTLQSALEALCGPLTQTLAEATALWESEGRPGEQPTVEFIDSPNNRMQATAWAADASLLVQGFYEVSNDLIGPREEELQVTVQPDADGDWTVSACETITTGISPLPDLPTQKAFTVSPGPVEVSAEPLLLDGVPVRGVGGGLVAPAGAIAAHGGFR